jgi:hypothetical protein
VGQRLEIGDRPVVLERVQHGVVPGVLEQRLLRGGDLVEEALLGDPPGPSAKASCSASSAKSATIRMTMLSPDATRSGNR